MSDCAHKCIIKPGCKYFTYGNWDNGKIQNCFQEHTSSSTCPEGFKYDEFNFYQMTGKYYQLCKYFSEIIYP